MTIIKEGIMPDGTNIHIEDWHDDYNFMPRARTVASYPISKMTKEGSFAPKAGELYRFSFDFQDSAAALSAFDSLLAGTTQLADYKEKITNLKYADCV